MKIDIECLTCLINRPIHVVRFLAKKSWPETIKFYKELLKFLIENLSEDETPAYIGSLREFFLQKYLNDPDPYKIIKVKSNEEARKIVEELGEIINFNKINYKNFRDALLLATAANAMEWFIPGYEVSFDDLKKIFLEVKFNISIDDSLSLWKKIKQSKKVLYILDNAGEAIIDAEFIKHLKKIVPTIVVGVKSSPVLNDITYDEALEIGLDKVADKVVPVSGYVGVIFKYTSEEFMKVYESSDLVIAKGMGNYESLSEYELEKPVYILLKAKCEPVARHLGVPRGSYVIKNLKNL
ncbi:MAG: damage-control phosphatase ARMT1 family protein [Candidatus Njordarchaeia archaeon]